MARQRTTIQRGSVVPPARVQSPAKVSDSERMSPGNLRNPIASDEIARLAYGHLGKLPELSYAPVIRPEKKLGARLTYGRHLRKGEPILVLYDGTFFGSGSQGFVVTAARFCWRNHRAMPRQSEWEQLHPEMVSVRDGSLAIARDLVHVDNSLAGDLGSFLQEMAWRMRSRGSTPYRIARMMDASEGAAAIADTIALLAWQKLGAMSGLRYYPFIEPQKIARAKAKHRGQLLEEEGLAALYEDTLRGVPRGFVITGKSLYWHASDGSTGMIAWRGARQAQFVDGEVSVKVDGTFLPWTLMFEDRADLPQSLVSLFHALVEKAYRGEFG